MNILEVYNRMANGVCSIPSRNPQKPVTIPQYQEALKGCKNKAQLVRVALRTLSSIGYHANIDVDLFDKIAPYLDDFRE